MSEGCFDEKYISSQLLRVVKNTCSVIVECMTTAVLVEVSFLADLELKYSCTFVSWDLFYKKRRSEFFLDVAIWNNNGPNLHTCISFFSSMCSKPIDILRKAAA